VFCETHRCFLVNILLTSTPVGSPLPTTWWCTALIGWELLCLRLICCILSSKVYMFLIQMYQVHLGTGVDVWFVPKCRYSKPVPWYWLYFECSYYWQGCQNLPIQGPSEGVGLPWESQEEEISCSLSCSAMPLHSLHSVCWWPPWLWSWCCGLYVGFTHAEKTDKLIQWFVALGAITLVTLPSIGPPIAVFEPPIFPQAIWVLPILSFWLDGVDLSMYAQ